MCHPRLLRFLSSGNCILGHGLEIRYNCRSANAQDPCPINSRSYNSYPRCAILINWLCGQQAGITHKPSHLIIPGIDVLCRPLMCCSCPGGLWTHFHLGCIASSDSTWPEGQRCKADDSSCPSSNISARVLQRACHGHAGEGDGVVIRFSQDRA